MDKLEEKEEVLEIALERALKVVNEVVLQRSNQGFPRDDRSEGKSQLLQGLCGECHGGFCLNLVLAPNIEEKV